MSEIHRIGESEIYKVGADGELVRDYGAEEEMVEWSEEQRREGFHVVDGEIVGRLSEEQAQKFSPIVLVMRGVAKKVARASVRLFPR